MVSRFPVERKFDLILFGASGFTGKLILEELVRTQKAGLSKPFTFAVAGRSVKKLKEALAEVSALTGVDLGHIETIDADIKRLSSLDYMTKECTLLLNAVGPYAKYGERIIKACIRTRTHQIDLSAESHSLTDLQVRYHKAAEEAGIYVVGSCGYDSILNECGINYLEKQFKGDLNSVESIVYSGSHLVTTGFNYGTWTSMLNFYAQFDKLRPLLRQLYPNELPKPKYELQTNYMVHKDEVGEVGWCLPFPHPDIWAVERSQNYFYEKEKKRPIQFASYLKQSNIFVTLLVLIGSLFVGLIMQLPKGVYLLDNFPRLFSGGIISKKGPSRKLMEKFDFSMTLIGQGWDQPLDKNEDSEYEIPPNKRVVLKISGTNPAYGATRTCFVQAAMTILEERSLLPLRGGVLTPGTAFAKTTIVDRLKKHGLKFDFI